MSELRIDRSKVRAAKYRDFESQSQLPKFSPNLKKKNGTLVWFSMRIGWRLFDFWIQIYSQKMYVLWELVYLSNTDKYIYFTYFGTYLEYLTLRDSCAAKKNKIKKIALWRPQKTGKFYESEMKILLAKYWRSSTLTRGGKILALMSKISAIFYSNRKKKIAACW